MRRGLVECDGAVDVGGEALLSVLLLASLIPVGGSQVEHAQDRPIGQQAEEVAQVAPGFDAVQSATGQERDEGRIDRAALVAAEEEPVLPYPSNRSRRDCGGGRGYWSWRCGEGSRSEERR